jgi:predicted phage terminase large subunit-like protein
MNTTPLAVTTALRRATSWKQKFAALIKMARVNFLAYVFLFNPPGTGDMVISRLHQFLARLVQAVADGTEKAYQTVSVPPQHGKSTLLAIEAASWIMGYKPGINLGLAGHRYDLMTEFSAKVKARTQHPWYKLVFPSVGVPLPGQNKADTWTLANGSNLRARSVGKKFTGNRLDWLIIDDAHAGREEAESEAHRRRVKRWYDGDCVSRYAPGTKVFIIGTRWHPKDLIGLLTNPDYVAGVRAAGYESRVFNVTNIPAIAQADDPLGREEGEALFPEVRPVEWLLGQKASIPSYEWRSQFMGEPRSITEGQVDVSKFVRIDLSQVPLDIPRLRGWDLALTEKQSSDYSVGALCAHDERTGYFYIIDVFREKLAWPKLKPRLLALALRDRLQWNSTRLGMEAVAGFEIGLQEVRSALSGQVRVEKRNPPRGGKLMRAQAWLNALEAGRVFLVNGAWTKDFLDELCEFPAGAHDDQVDAVSVSWESLVKGGKLVYA